METLPHDTRIDVRLPRKLEARLRIATRTRPLGVRIPAERFELPFDDDEPRPVREPKSLGSQ